MIAWANESGFGTCEQSDLVVVAIGSVGTASTVVMVGSGIAVDCGGTGLGVFVTLGEVASGGADSGAFVAVAFGETAVVVALTTAVGNIVACAGAVIAVGVAVTEGISIAGVGEAMPIVV